MFPAQPGLSQKARKQKYHSQEATGQDLDAASERPKCCLDTEPTKILPNSSVSPQNWPDPTVQPQSPPAPQGDGILVTALQPRAIGN